MKKLALIVSCIWLVGNAISVVWMLQTGGGSYRAVHPLTLLPYAALIAAYFLPGKLWLTYVAFVLNIVLAAAGFLSTFLVGVFGGPELRLMAAVFAGAILFPGVLNTLALKQMLKERKGVVAKNDGQQGVPADGSRPAGETRR